MIYIGNNEISNIYIGTDKIYGIYVGDLQIYPTDIILTAISLENLVWVTNIPASGGTATKENCTYSVTAYYSDGATVDVTSEATITGSQVIPNTDIEEVHSAGTLTLTASYSGFTATGSVTVYQEAAESSDFSKKPLTFNILSAGTIIWAASNASIAKTIDYKLNNGAWVSITSNTSSSAPKINVVEGDKIQFKGNNTQYATRESNYNSFSGSTASFEVEGNIMSLIYGDDFKNNSTISSNYAFYSLFRDCTKLVSAENLILPATTLTDYCYYNMFTNCTSLTTAPKLPATTLVYGCYYRMFNVCKSLTTAPELPATTLAGSCYYEMFQYCSKLTTAPSVLPATTLAYGCYKNMFRGCKSLTTAPELPATTLARDCYSQMFYECTSLTKVPKLPARTLAESCYSYMFGGCTSLTTAPELPATTLNKNDCYGSMFRDCTSLTTAPELPATTLTDFCYRNMFQGCKSLTTAPVLPATTLTDYCYSGMFQGCKSLNYIKCLATDISASNCTSNWVNGVASTGTFVKNPNMTSWGAGTSGIPNGWTVEDNQEPLTFNILSAGTINWTVSDSSASIAKTIDYKLNNGAWVSITSNAGSQAPKINVAEGDKLQFRGNNAQYATSPSTHNSFGGSALFEAEGNIMSLIYGDNFKNNLTISSNYAFLGLFRDCTNLVSAENLILPATTLADGCYLSMFRDCTKLTTAPKELPATTLASECYNQMFYNCSSLTTTPELPATTLADYCYYNMFCNCSSLTTAPALPATTLVNDCYGYMFQNCSSLTSAPELPATTLVDECYQGMFADCSSLNYIKCLATDIYAYGCTDAWVYGVAPTGTFVKNLDMYDWEIGSTDYNGIPDGWDIEDA